MIGGASGRIPAAIELTVPAGTQAMPLNKASRRDWSFQQELLVQRDYAIRVWSDVLLDVQTTRGDTTTVRWLTGVLEMPGDEDDKDDAGWGRDPASDPLRAPSGEYAESPAIR